MSHPTRCWACARPSLLRIASLRGSRTGVRTPLYLCKGCGCVLELKIHTPLIHVRDNLSDEERAKLMKLNQRCWILTETP